MISREDFTRILLDAAAAFEPASSTTVSAAPAVADAAHNPAPPATTCTGTAPVHSYLCPEYAVEESR